MRLYIAGPMTGLPDLNYPAFNAEAERLRSLGYEVENPAENPEPECGTWEGYMRLGITQLMTCDAVVQLPGWGGSRGALIEVSLAKKLGIKRFDQGKIRTPCRTTFEGVRHGHKTN